MTLYSKHLTLGLDAETALGTPAGAIKEIRWDEATFPNRPGNLVEQPNLGHEHMANTDDRPVTHSTRIDDGIQLTIKLRKDNGTNVNPLASFLLSGGCNNKEGGTVSADDTLAAYVSTTDFTLTADSSQIGSAGALKLTAAGKYLNHYFPVLTADYAVKAITPSMAIPAASEVSAPYLPMHCFTPGMGVPVGATSTLTLVQQTRAPHTATEDWNFNNLGCALSNFGPLVFEAGGQVTIPMSLHVCKVDDAAGLLAASVFLDAEKHILIDDLCELGYANFAAAGGIASSALEFKKLEFDPGVAVEGNTATGAGSCGDTANYFANYTPATVTLTVNFAKVYFDDFQTEAQTPKYIHLIQGTDAPTTKPCFGLWFPKCTLMADGATYDTSANYVQAVLKYKLSAANYGTDTSNDSRGNAPWYFAFD